MFKIKPRFILTSCLFLLSACSFTGTNSAPAQPTAEFIIEGLCDNLLYPVKQNATWTYSSTDGTNNFNTTETITQVTSAGFTVTSQVNDSTHTQAWSCETGGLKALQLGAINYLTSQSSILEVTGVSLPKELISGMQWLYSLKLENGTYTVIMQEMGSESITTPAGTFNATKFQANHQFESADINLNFTNASTVWYAQSIGLIKLIDDVQKSDGAFSVTTALQSYSIP
jgi:hypothetical protein